MTTIVLTLFLLGLVWGAVVLRFGGLLAACLAILFLGTVFGPPFFSHRVGPLPITADRLGLVVVAAVGLAGWSRGLVRCRPISRPDVLMASFLAILTVSTFTHDWWIESAQPVSNLVFYFVLPAIVYCVARNSRLDDRQLRVAIGFFVALGLYLAVTAVAEANQAWWLVYPKFIASPEYEEFFGRGRGPILNPVGTGLYLIVGLACVGVLWPATATSHGNRRVRQCFVLLGTAVMLAGLYCTLTRSIWLAAALVVGLFLIPHIPPRFRPSAAIACLLVVASLLALRWESLHSFKRDQNVSVHDMGQSAGLRPVLATVAWHMFWDRPIAGCGFGQYKQHDAAYLRDPNSSRPLEQARPYNQHNVLLALLTETGLMGVSAFLAMGAYWVRDAWSLLRSASPWGRRLGRVSLGLLLAYGVNGVLHDVTVIPMVHMLLFLWAGVCRGWLLERSFEQVSAAPLSAPQLHPAT